MFLSRSAVHQENTWFLVGCQPFVAPATRGANTFVVKLSAIPYPTFHVRFATKYSVQVMVCDDGAIVENVETAAVKTVGTAPLAVDGGEEGEEASGGPAPRSSAGKDLFDVILLGGGVGTEAAELVTVGDGDGEGASIPERGRTPAGRLDLVLDRWVGIQ